jgi:diguanylate cyclase (GGDEF)-like protein
VLVTLVGIAASAWIAGSWNAAVTRQRGERLDRTAVSRTTTIGNALSHYEDALQAERSLWLASTFVSRKDFKVFAATLDLPQRYPGLQRISWRSFVPDERADAFVAGARRDGAPHFTIRPPGRRPVYYVTLYSELSSRYGSTIGLDARATIPSILAALERARDTGQTTMSNQTTLAIDERLPPAQRPVAFELLVPVYRHRAPVVTVAQRRAAFLGWACGQFRARDLLHEAMKSVQATTGVELYDPAVGGDPIAAFPEGFRAAGPDVRADAVTLGGRTFRLRYAPLPGNPVLAERTFPASLLLATGTGISLLLGTLLWLLAQVSTLYRRVGRMARTDALTGVLNRRVLDHELPRELGRATRTGRPLCVALVDLNHFKAYNDRHGHQAGDRLLKAAGAAWGACLRNTDLLVRYGGEEFAVVLPDCVLEDAMAIAERLRTAQPEGTCSIGVAQWVPGETVDELIGRADQALYAAKAGGRDRCCASPSPPAPEGRILENSPGPSGLEAR